MSRLCNTITGDIIEDTIFVFSPKGDISELKKELPL